MLLLLHYYGVLDPFSCKAAGTYSDISMHIDNKMYTFVIKVFHRKKRIVRPSQRDSSKLKIHYHIAISCLHIGYSFMIYHKKIYCHKVHWLPVIRLVICVMFECGAFVEYLTSNGHAANSLLPQESDRDGICVIHHSFLFDVPLEAHYRRMQYYNYNLGYYI